MTAPVPPDENVLTLPDAWRRLLHPRRGGTAVPPPRGSRAKEVPGLLADADDHVRRLPSGGDVEPELREAARRHLGGAPDPAGAAAVAAVAIVRGGGNRETKGDCRPFVDHWRAEHGIGFAACAAVELSRLRVHGTDGRRTPERSDNPHLGAIRRETLRHLRRLLVAASDEDHADAVRRMADHRTTPQRRRVVSYLVPGRSDWLDASMADKAHVNDDRWLKLHSADRADRLAGPSPALFHADVTRGLLATLLDACGPDVLPVLLSSLDLGLPAREHRLLLEAVALLPTDAAFSALLERAGQGRVRPVLMTMMRRFPLRAARVLAATDTAPALELLKSHITAHPELAGRLPDGARAVLEASDAPPEADPASLPEPLSGLPWDRPVKPVVRGLEPPAARTITWREGERDRWAATGADLPAPDAVDWDDLANVLAAEVDAEVEAGIVLHGPQERVRPVLADWEGPAAWHDVEWAGALVARYELDAYPVARRMAKGAPWWHARLLEPFLDAEVAALMGDWLLGKRSVDVARDWCDRHGLAAVPFVAPAALGRAAARRRAAEAVLRRVADRHGVDAVAAAVPAAAAELRAVLTASPAATGLLRRPEPDAWADPATLPRVLLRGRERALAPETMRTLLELMALPELRGMDVVVRECDPASLAECGLALFERWRSTGMPADDVWALAQLARIGDDSAVPVLEPLVRSWPGKDRMHSALLGLDVLAGIGTDAALTAVHDIAVRWPGARLRTAAAEAFARAAAARGVPAGVLGDRLVPDLGLDADGAVPVDYGRRRFTVRFDGGLRPVVTDEDGRLRKSLPKPGKRDDPGVAPAAHAAFTALRKRIDAAASFQVLRLRGAMETGRRWTPEEFRAYTVRNPLVRLLARRLVWLAEDGPGSTAFRIAEDGTLADAADDSFEPPETARISVAHPVRLGAAVRTWAGILADYELLQPFPQLDHPVWTLAEDERAGAVLGRFAGRDVPMVRVSELLGRGWSRNGDGTAGQIEWIAHQVAADRFVVVELDPCEDDPAHMTIRCVRAATAPGPSGVPVPFGDLDPVAASEALTDLAIPSGAAL